MKATASPGELQGEFSGIAAKNKSSSPQTRLQTDTACCLSRGSREAPRQPRQQQAGTPHMRPGWADPWVATRPGSQHYSVDLKPSSSEENSQGGYITYSRICSLLFCQLLVLIKTSIKIL
ncbi:Cell Division Cycle 7-Related Protein Kinase [Manis pentadactyla]|nr:Cell Division Cycle 7-Related Protein Kinase [Manis pentadactyla]